MHNTDNVSLEVHAAEAESDAADDFGAMFDDETGGDPDAQQAAPKKPAKPAEKKPAAKPVQPGAEDLEIEEEEEVETEAEPEVEAEEQTEGEEEEETDDDALKGARDPDKVNAMLQKRKEQRDAAIVERDAAVKELETLRGTQPAAPVLLAPTPANPVSHLFKPEDLTTADQQWTAELEWCQENLEGGSRPGPDGKPVEWDAAKVKARMKQSLEVLRTHLPAREKYLTEFAADRESAGKRMPFLSPKDAGFPEVVKWADGILAKAPGLAAHPAHVSLLGKAWIGEAVLSGKLTPVLQSDGSVKLVKVNGVSDGTGKPKKVTGESVKPVLRKPGTPPVRRADGKTKLAEVLEHGTADEAAEAEMEDLYNEAA